MATITADRFGNPHAVNLPYARGKILATTAGDRRSPDQIRPAVDLARFGGAAKYATAIDDTLSRLGALLREPEAIRTLLFGD